MTQTEARRLARAALHEAHTRAGDDEGAVKVEFVTMMRRDRQLHDALTVLGVARLWESQNLRH